MNEKLMTFREMRTCGKNFIGSKVEIVLGGTNVRRGTLNTIRWWNNGSPSHINWTNSMMWNAAADKWIFAQLSCSLDFKFDTSEWFWGPCRSGSGEFFFHYDKRFCVTIFPRGWILPKAPRYTALNEILCAQFPRYSAPHIKL